MIDRKARDKMVDAPSLPVGTNVQIAREQGCDADDYASRLRTFYAGCSAGAFAEERDLAERLSASDASLPAEEPWW